MCASTTRNSRAVALPSEPPLSNQVTHLNNSSPCGRNGLDIEDSTEKLLNDLVLALLASVLDDLDLLLGVLACFSLGLLVALAVLWSYALDLAVGEERGGGRTSASNFLYSFSLFDL